MRLIDADALIGQYNKLVLTAQTDYAEGVRDVINDINNAPTIEPKRGEWIKDKSSPIAYRCTACNTLQHWSVIQDGRYHFCPNCGADMREVRDE